MRGHLAAILALGLAGCGGEGQSNLTILGYAPLTPPQAEIRNLVTLKTVEQQPRARVPVRNVTYTITGESLGNIQAVDNSTLSGAAAPGGLLSFKTKSGVEPSESAPLTLEVRVSAPGYRELTQELSISSSGRQLVELQMIPDLRGEGGVSLGLPDGEGETAASVSAFDPSTGAATEDVVVATSVVRNEAETATAKASTGPKAGESNSLKDFGGILTIPTGTQVGYLNAGSFVPAKPPLKATIFSSNAYALDSATSTGSVFTGVTSQPRYCPVSYYYPTGGYCAEYGFSSYSCGFFNRCYYLYCSRWQTTYSYYTSYQVCGTDTVETRQRFFHGYTIRANLSDADGREVTEFRNGTPTVTIPVSEPLFNATAERLAAEGDSIQVWRPNDRGQPIVSGSFNHQAKTSGSFVRNTATNELTVVVPLDQPTVDGSGNPTNYKLGWLTDRGVCQLPRNDSRASVVVRTNLPDLSTDARGYFRYTELTNSRGESLEFLAGSPLDYYRALTPSSANALASFRLPLLTYPAKVRFKGPTFSAAPTVIGTADIDMASICQQMKANPNLKEVTPSVSFSAPAPSGNAIRFKAEEACQDGSEASPLPNYTAYLLIKRSDPSVPVYVPGTGKTRIDANRMAPLLDYVYPLIGSAGAADGAASLKNLPSDGTGIAVTGSFYDERNDFKFALRSPDYPQADLNVLPDYLGQTVLPTETRLTSLTSGPVNAVLRRPRRCVAVTGASD